MKARQERLAENEALFREANDKLAELSRLLATSRDELAPFLCECGESRCTRVIRLTLGEYATVRGHPSRFAIVAGHEDPDERVVEENERYSVVEKLMVLRNAHENG